MNYTNFCFISELQKNFLECNLMFYYIYLKYIIITCQWRVIIKLTLRVFTFMFKNVYLGRVCVRKRCVNKGGNIFRCETKLTN